LQNTPLHPVVGWGRTRFGGPEVAPERRLAELESLLAAVKLDAAKHAPLLAPMVDTPVPPERLAGLSPEEVRRRQLAAMVEWAIAGAHDPHRHHARHLRRVGSVAFESELDARGRRLIWVERTALDQLTTLRGVGVA
jgi:hypothetical protein